MNARPKPEAIAGKLECSGEDPPRDSLPELSLAPSIGSLQNILPEKNLR